MELGCTGTREKVERNHEAYMNLAFIDMRTSCPQRFGWILLVLAVASASAQPTITTSSADPQIAAALKQISAEKIRANIEKLASFQTRSTLSAQDQASIAAGHGIGAARKWIKSEFERYSRDCGGRLEVKTDSFTEQPADRIPKPTEITNVYAVLKGTDPENAKRVVLVTGHYDSRNSDTLDTTGVAPGANDDASGTAVSLECARVLSRLKFPATIIFLTVAGEEQGLNGSHHFAQMAKSEGWNIEAVLNNDIVGGDRNSQQDPSVVRVFSEGVPSAATDTELKLIRNLGGESDSPSRQIARYVGEVGRTYVVGLKPTLVFRLDRYLRGGDHISFNQQGFAAVRFTEYREDYHHQHQNVRTENGIEYGDVPKFVNFDYVANVSRLNAATLASLASAPAPPDKVRLVTKELENDSTLTWEPSPGSRTDAYEVLWRATTSAEWEHTQPVGNVTKTTLPISKDNVIFAVRAVDKEGHRSLPVVPLPER
ncbi:MAG: peptidase M28 [Acidobacteria bacterium]|nr:MAG: peptidase M28 [Acidobacteriota bacterium]PYX17959.1 MAG: peptidase M28 [Acidobacteriota bacterium]